MRLQEKYQKEVIPALKEKFNYKNVFSVPKITKVSVNVGIGKHNKEKDYAEMVAGNIVRITGQKPVLTKAKKAISAFKTRKGLIIGVAVTLRGQRMYDFLEKLVNISLPRIRDFRGISDKQIDAKGNITIGFKENLSFPEIENEDASNIHGLEISIATTAETRDEGLELFRLMGFPFKKD